MTSGEAKEPTGYPRIMPVGDSAVLIEFGPGIDPKVNDAVYILAQMMAGMIYEVVPTYRSLLAGYDPLKTSYDQLHGFLAKFGPKALELERNPGTVRTIEIPVVYGGEEGPDLGTVADHAGISGQEVVDIHSSVSYRVYMLGFAPGFPYLGGLDERIACPRLETPRLRVAAGSVGIAETQTGVYPNESPGGWQIIGRTAVKLFDPVSPLSPPPPMSETGSPALITPGSEVRFVPVESHE